MTQQRLIIGTLLAVSALLVLGGALAFICFEPSQYEALGSLLGGVGSFLAVIWFSASLFYQSVQLKEQREQFSREFAHLREESRRNALSFAKDILREAEERALKANPALQAIDNLPMAYLDFGPLKVIMESTDPFEVQKAVAEWSKKILPAQTLMSGIKDAAEVYFTATGRTDIDYSKKPADFVFVYGPALWKLPYFDRYASVAVILTEFMIRKIEPGTKSVTLAAMVASMKMSPQIMKVDKIIDDVKNHRKAGLPVPAIAADIY